MSYSPREGANCIKKQSDNKKQAVKVTVPVRVRIASVNGVEFNWDIDQVTVPVRVRIASRMVNQLTFRILGYSPREGANCISKRIQFV